MLPIFGIDLGTTFCCVSYIGANGKPVVVPDLEGGQTTPSVVAVAGDKASFGRRAGAKRYAGVKVYQYFKRDIGKPATELGPKYRINGYDFQAAGLQALLLRYLRAGVVAHLIRECQMTAAEAEGASLEAVVTVPAYFREEQRRETRAAALAAGWNVAGIINEPTAAALTFGHGLDQEQTLLVFDLGGGTFDVTVMRTGKGHVKVLASTGAHELGGKEWDELIGQYLKEAFRQKFGRTVPDELVWQVQDAATQAKIALSDELQTTVRLPYNGEILEVKLDREEDADDFYLPTTADAGFVFEGRSADLLTKCRTVLGLVLKEAKQGWNDIDEIVLAGGSSRMPMVARMLARVAGRPLAHARPGFSYDTAISIGAALYGSQEATVTDVVAHSIGVEFLNDADRPYVELLLKKNTPLPQAIFEEKYEALPDAILKVYEGEGTSMSDYPRGPMGELRVGNPTRCEVQVRLSLDAGGLIKASVGYDGGETRSAEIKSSGNNLDLVALTTRVQALALELP